MADRPTNILLITTDQQRFDTIHAGGNPCIYTPHLDWLAESGIRFTKCYSDSPVCCAARASLLTGRYAPALIRDGFGWWGNPTAPDNRNTWPGLLTAAGYQTRSIGKQHFHPERCNYGFESMEILQDYYRHMARFPHLGRPMDHGLGQNEMTPAISTVDESSSLTRWIVDRAVDFVETRDPTRPFALNLGFSKPHPPLDPCRNYRDLYAQAAVPEPIYGDWSAVAENIPGGFMESTWMLGGVDAFSPELIRDMRRAYYACITQVDYNLGYLFARMRELDLLDSTLIVFTSDHGEMLGDHHMCAKNHFLEGSSHIPLIVRPPLSLTTGAPRGQTCDALVCLADIYPTLCTITGTPMPSAVRIDGVDLLATARGTTPRASLLGRCSHYFTIIEPPFKYCYTSLGGGELLFDLERDPQERHNLAGLETAAETHRRLRRRLVEYLAQENHSDVVNGDLRATQPAPTRADVRARAWPGFHTRQCPIDVTH